MRDIKPKLCPQIHESEQFQGIDGILQEGMVVSLL